MFDFPMSPAEGQTFTPPGGPTYVYEDPAWKRQPGGPALVAIRDDPPPTPTGGQIWWESDTGETYVWFNDGATQQWVQIAGPVPGLADAPADGMQYLRKDAAWAAAPTGDGLTDAPGDGKTYGRKSNGWVDVSAELLSGKYLPLAGGTLTGDLTIAKATPLFVLNRPAAGSPAYIIGQTAGKNRWSMELGNGGAESGGNAGSDFTLSRWNDAGSALLDTPIYIARSNAWTQIKGNIAINKANPYLNLHKSAAGQDAVFQSALADKARWAMHMADAGAESGANAGSNFAFSRYTDAGAWIDQPLYIYRDSGIAYLKNGLVLQNLSAFASTLDYYNEGTFVPVIRFGGASTGITYSTQQGWWARVGRIVTIQGRVILSSKGALTGNASIGGLPFSATGALGYGTLACAYFQAFTGSVGWGPPMVLPVGGAAADLYINASSITPLQASSFTNTTDILFGGSYVCD